MLLTFLFSKICRQNNQKVTPIFFSILLSMYCGVDAFAGGTADEFYNACVQQTKTNQKFADWASGFPTGDKGGYACGLTTKAYCLEGVYLKDSTCANYGQYPDLGIRQMITYNGFPPGMPVPHPDSLTHVEYIYPGADRVVGTNQLLGSNTPISIGSSAPVISSAPVRSQNEGADSRVNAPAPTTPQRSQNESTNTTVNPPTGGSSNGAQTVTGGGQQQPQTSGNPPQSSQQQVLSSGPDASATNCSTIKIQTENGQSWRCAAYNERLPDGIQCYPPGSSTLGVTSNNTCGATADPNALRQEMINAQNALEQCEQPFKKAQDCCTDPMKCIFGSSMSGNDMALIQSVMGGAMMASGASGDSASIERACKIMKVAGMAAAGANVAGAQMCNTERTTCQSRCEELMNTYKSKLAAPAPSGCGIPLSASGTPIGIGSPVPSPGCPSAERIFQTYNQLKSRRDACESYGSRETLMHVQAVQSGLSAAFAQKCSSMASTAGSGFEEIDTEVVDAADCANPANANNPICAQCRGPEAANNPFCRGLANTNVNGGSGYAADRKAQYGSASKYDLGADGSAQQQGAQPAGGNLVDAKANGVPQGGGGMPAGGGSGSFGSEGGGGSRPGGGYNTDVLSGFSGGGGYNVGGAGQLSGGEGGFSGYGGGPAKKDDQKFDLKQFLPGGQQDPRRGIAGLGAARVDIGPMSANIFDRISTRVKTLCTKNRMYDCE